MFALPYLSGSEFVTMLGRFGYQPRSRSGGVAALHREANVVIVPEASNLSPTLVRAMLRTAKIDPHDFLRAFCSQTSANDTDGPPSRQVA